MAVDPDRIGDCTETKASLHYRVIPPLWHRKRTIRSQGPGPIPAPAVPRPRKSSSLRGCHSPRLKKGKRKRNVDVGSTDFFPRRGRGLCHRATKKIIIIRNSNSHSCCTVESSISQLLRWIPPFGSVRLRYISARRESPMPPLYGPFHRVSTDRASRARSTQLRTHTR